MLVKLTALLCLTIIVHKFNGIMLVINLLLLTLLLGFYRASNALRMLKRLRWLILTMLLVYAFNTPGEYINFGYVNPLPIAPTYEGLEAGISQAFRLCVVVMALALLLARTNRDFLIGGLYTLFKPLSSFGLDPERFAVRLWLTLYYVENAEVSRSKGEQYNSSFFTQILSKFDILNGDEITQHQMLDSITLQVEAFRWIDIFVLLIVLGMTIFYMGYF